MVNVAVTEKVRRAAVDESKMVFSVNCMYKKLLFSVYEMSFSVYIFN